MAENGNLLLKFLRQRLDLVQIIFNTRRERKNTYFHYFVIFS